MKYIKNIVLGFILAIFLITPVFALDSSEKIYDNIEILSETEELELEEIIDNFTLKYDTDLVIVTNNNITPYDNIESYAENYFNTNGFGIGDNKEGILLAIINSSDSEQIYAYFSGKETNLVFKNTSLVDSSKDSTVSYFEFLSKTIKEMEQEKDNYLNNNKNEQQEKKYSKIYDDAKLLNDSEKELLNNLAEEFVKKYDMDLIIATTLNNSSSGSTKSYAEDFYDYNGFGIGKTYDGILFLIDRTYGENDTYFLSTGQAILIYDDNRVNYVLNDIYNVKDYGYYKMFEQFIESSSKYAEKGVAASYKDYYIDENGDLQKKRIFPIFLFIGISIVISSIVVVIFLLKNKMVKKATKANEYLDQKSINFTTKEDRFINTHTTRTHIPKSTGSSGGGSSISRGSSGRSHGGGGRRM